MSDHHRSLDRALAGITDLFWQFPVPDLFAEPLLSLADRDNHVTLPDACALLCAYGGCGSSGYEGCGGCCHCRGGCVVAWENEQTAPFVWNGDPA